MAELVNKYLPESTFNQTFSIMDINNDTIVTLDEFFNTLNVVVKKVFHEGYASDMLIDLSKLESKLANNSLDTEMALSEFKEATHPVCLLCVLF